MTTALPSYVQPMLIGDQPQLSSLQLSDKDDHCKDVLGENCYPSPSCASSLSQSPTSACSLDKDGSPSASPVEVEDNHKPRHLDSMDTVNSNSTNYAQQPPDDRSETDEPTEELSISSETSVSPSLSQSQCRYCYKDLHKALSVSQCHCTGVLCRECLVRELKLTHNRASHQLHCTVCRSEYETTTEFSFDCRQHCGSLCVGALIHCGLKDEQYLLDSFGGKLGFLLVVLGINTWVLSTSLLFAFPPNGCPVELYYMVSVFDFAVGVSTIWFIIKCRYLSPFCLSIMYFLRTVYIVLGWIPAINLCNINEYHTKQADHVVILCYFVLFSFCASMIMHVCWIVDLTHQYRKYSKENGVLVLDSNDIKIEVHDILGRDKDQF